MSSEAKFKTALELIFQHGGSPEYVVVPGLGEFYWPKLSEVDRAMLLGFREGWRARGKHIYEEDGF